LSLGLFEALIDLSRSLWYLEKKKKRVENQSFGHKTPLP
jgi:hypothetical protein